MQRDMDLARHILLAVEAHPTQAPMSVEIEGRSNAEVQYHVKLLHEAGLIEVYEPERADSMWWMPTRLTWAGHEFLDEARDEQRWTKAKSIAKQVGGLGLDVLKSVLTELAKTAAIRAITGAS